MLKEERQNIILTEVLLHNRVLFGDLSDLLKVSVDTVRRDVKELDAMHKLKKVHGGAVSLGFNVLQYEEQDIYLQKQKIEIANKAVKFLHNDQVILVSGGTTILELINKIPSKLKLTIFTPSLPVAIKLTAFPNIEVIFIGGKLSKQAQITVGGNTIKTLSQIKVDLCFLGTGYIDSEYGLSELDWEVVQVKKAMMEASKKTILLTISQKINSTQRFKICDISAIDTLITELDPRSEFLKPFTTQNIQVL